MSDLQQQLQALRERVAGIDRKYARASPDRLPHRPNPYKTGLPGVDPHFDLGAAVETSRGVHFESETLYASHRRHGSADIGALGDLPADHLSAIAPDEMATAEPSQWAFLDTETTGMGGNAGSCAFLIGVGHIAPDGFRVRQFFLRDYAEEASALDALAAYLARFRVLVTYNGRSFDQPLLETRYRLHRTRPPFARLSHLDLLHGARRLWKLRYQSCRLVDLEQQVLGFERENDVPGALIPYLYFEYQRTRRAARLLPVFQHNALDILSLACLTAIVPRAFENHSAIAHGGELLGLARWRRQTGDLAEARDLLRRAIDAGLPDDLLFRSLWDLASTERKLGAGDAALSLWTDLAASRNPYRVAALEELAKHHEHRTRDIAQALAYTRAALDLAGQFDKDTPALRHRERRLLSRMR